MVEAEYEKKWGAKQEPVAVIIYMEHVRVEGSMFRVPHMRVSDAINQATNFIALKDATVYPLDSDTPILSKPFIAIATKHIVFMAEKD